MFCSYSLVPHSPPLTSLWRLCHSRHSFSLWPVRSYVYLSTYLPFFIPCCYLVVRTLRYYLKTPESMHHCVALGTTAGSTCESVHSLYKCLLYSRVHGVYCTYSTVYFLYRSQLLLPHRTVVFNTGNKPLLATVR